MKKLLLILFLIIGICLPAQADDKIILKSETGVVENVKYEDAVIINQGEQTTKQEVSVRVLTGDVKGSERIIDNMLTGNPAYDIPLSKGDKVILHMEPVSDTVTAPEDVDIFIADIQRNTEIYIFTGIFCILLLIIGEKKALTSIK